MLLSTFLRDRSGRRDIPLSPHCISRGRRMQGTFPGNGCLSDSEAPPRQPVRHVAPVGAAAEALALLPVAGAGQLSQRLPALAEGGGGGGTKGDHCLPCEVICLHKSVDRPCAAAPPDGIIKCSQFPSCVDFTGFNCIQNCVYCYYLSFFSKIALKHRPHYFHI